MDDHARENSHAQPEADKHEGEARQEGSRLSGVRLVASQFFTDYGMLAVLLLLILFFSLVTIEKRRPIGAEAAESVAGRNRSRRWAGRARAHCGASE